MLEGLKFMMELKVVLDFGCCTCEQPVSATVKCSGKGLVAGTRTVATVNIPCPYCGTVNQVYFEPSGTIHAVLPDRGRRVIPEPSLN